MGESGNLFNIPAYIKIGNKKFRVIKLGANGLILENKPEIPLEEIITVDFIFPYDAYNELVIPKLKIRCQEENGKLYCQFKDLSREQEDIIRFIIREHLWKRIISIPSEFMNYTQDKKVREELLILQRDLSLKDKIHKILLVAVLMFVGSLLTLTANSFLKEESKPLSIKYSERSENFEKGSLKRPSIPKKENYQLENSILKENNQPEKPQQTVKVAEKSKTLEETNFNPEVRFLEDPQKGKKSKDPTTRLSPKRNYYCVQVASDTLPDRLILLAKELEDLPFVRVEKVGRFYTLRIGFSQTHREGKILAEKVKERIQGEIFLRICAYRPKRWIYPQTEER